MTPGKGIRINPTTVAGNRPEGQTVTGCSVGMTQVVDGNAAGDALTAHVKFGSCHEKFGEFHVKFGGG